MATNLVIPDDSSTIKLSLLSQGIILITGEINWETYDELFKYFHALESIGSPPVEIRFRSAGGLVEAGLDIYDLIKRYPGKTTGIVYSKANSMASVALQACTRRLALPHAVILIHSVRMNGISLDVLNNEKRRSARIKKLKDDNNRNIAIYCSRAKTSRKEIVAQMKKDSPLSAKESLALGLIDAII